MDSSWYYRAPIFKFALLLCLFPTSDTASLRVLVIQRFRSVPRHVMTGSFSCSTIQRHSAGRTENIVAVEPTLFQASALGQAYRMKSCADEIHNMPLIFLKAPSLRGTGVVKDSSKRYQEGFYQENFSTCKDARGTISGRSSGYR